MMRRTKTALLAPATALLLGWYLQGAFSFGVEVEEAEQQNQAEETAVQVVEPVGEDASAETVEPAARPAPVPAAQVSRSTAPPKHLKKVGDHWTAWDPPNPESFPPAATLHIIVRGDTLWDLADLTFNDPYLWPQIWNENRYILDSHWIYPGDPLMIPARPVVVTPAGTGAAAAEILPQGQQGAPQAAFPSPPTAADPVPGPLTAEAPAAAAPPAAPPQVATGPDTNRPTPLIDRSDLGCSGFIGEKKISNAIRIAGQEETAKIGLTLQDLVYLNQGEGEVAPGDEFSVVRRMSEISHPESGRRIGWYYERLGRVKVLAAFEQMSIAVITLACDEIRAGHQLVPYDPGPFPVRPVPRFSKSDFMANGNEIGYLVHAKDDVKIIGTGNVVFVNLGHEDGLAPGDFLMAFEPALPSFGTAREKINYDYQWGNARFTTQNFKPGSAKNFPPRILGQMIVMSTENHTAAAKVIYSLREMEIGTMVEAQ